MIGIPYTLAGSRIFHITSSAIALSIIPVLSIWEKPITESLSELYFSAFGYKF